MSTTRKMAPWIQTFGGGKFDLADINRSCKRLSIEAIAHSLSNTCRFNGHCNKFYSVAEHSVRMTRLFPWNDWQSRYDCLFHDSHEPFFMGDIPSPYKFIFEDPEQCKDFRYYNEEIKNTLALVYSFRYPIVQDVIRADLVLLATEARDLMSPVAENWHYSLPFMPLSRRIRPWSPRKAKRKFLNEFFRLSDRICPFPYRDRRNWFQRNFC